MSLVRRSKKKVLKNDRSKDARLFADSSEPIPDSDVEGFIFFSPLVGFRSPGQEKGEAGCGSDEIRPRERSPVMG